MAISILLEGSKSSGKERVLSALKEEIKDIDVIEEVDPLQMITADVRERTISRLLTDKSKKRSCVSCNSLYYPSMYYYKYVDEADKIEVSKEDYERLENCFDYKIICAPEDFVGYRGQDDPEEIEKNEYFWDSYWTLLNGENQETHSFLRVNNDFFTNKYSKGGVSSLKDYFLYDKNTDTFTSYYYNMIMNMEEFTRFLKRRLPSKGKEK